MIHLANLPNYLYWHPTTTHVQTHAASIINERSSFILINHICMRAGN
jgi:hypothetical protein